MKIKLNKWFFLSNTGLQEWSRFAFMSQNPHSIGQQGSLFYSISRIRSRSHPKCSAPDRIHNTVKYRNIKAQSGPQKYGTYLSSWPGRSRRCLLPWADDLWWSSSACPEPLRTTSPPLPPLCYPEIIELQIRMVSSSHPTVHYNTVNIVHWPASQPALPGKSGGSACWDTCPAAATHQRTASSLVVTIEKRESQWSVFLTPWFNEMQEAVKTKVDAVRWIQIQKFFIVGSRSEKCSF